jgi:nucleotide-binding universal stress UspA family protein
MYKHILVPTDGSDITDKASSAAIGLAKALGARLSTITIKEAYPYSALSEIRPVPPQEFLDSQEQLAQRNVQKVVSACKEAGLDCEAVTVEADHPHVAIIEHASRHGCDLIVMASHGRRGMQALLLGSETQKVLTHSRIAVLVVR